MERIKDIAGNGGGFGVLERDGYIFTLGGL